MSVAIASQVYPNGVVQFEVSCSLDLRIDCDLRLRDLCMKEGIPMIADITPTRWLLHVKMEDCPRIKSQLGRILRPLVRGEIQ